MSTGAIGGQPTITHRQFSFSSNLTNFLFYTAPANTLTIVDLHFITVGGGGTFALQALGVASPDANAGTVYKGLDGISGSIVASGAVLMGNLCYVAQVSGGNRSAGALLGRMENPIQSLVNGGSALAWTGQLKLYDGESLFISCNIVSGSPINVNYSTLEITSGS